MTLLRSVLCSRFGFYVDACGVRMASSDPDLPEHRPLGLERIGLSGRSRGSLLGDLSLLQNPDRVAEGVSNAHVNTVEVLGGLLREIGDTALAERVVHLSLIHI